MPVCFIYQLRLMIYHFATQVYSPELGTAKPNQQSPASAKFCLQGRSPQLNWLLLPVTLKWNQTRRTVWGTQHSRSVFAPWLSFHLKSDPSRLMSFKCFFLNTAAVVLASAQLQTAVSRNFLLHVVCLITQDFEMMLACFHPFVKHKVWPH